MSYWPLQIHILCPQQMLRARENRETFEEVSCGDGDTQQLFLSQMKRKAEGDVSHVPRARVSFGQHREEREFWPGPIF